jgi:antitoxin component YwqK of YwqJK toxin-antitoxin module
MKFIGDQMITHKTTKYLGCLSNAEVFLEYNY